ncbi:DNA cytosine methyltransferase [Pontibacter qinzhouensis]|uniref:Cytosine-specific methyltransferase n=1 Tax=Pontibacter qinzhouensis TaxID=2603253 RepID=A0A5C8JGD3_9BACT|nr:DNA cytosine methyltransferase [Pontibacter qinzhouensis]TXK36462.1 DNA cytosine methyltransferase [Pontibacter qinzhouensis]
MAYNIIDLFSGAGGFTLGFTKHRTQEGVPAFNPVWANDFNRESVDTYNANFGDHCVYGDITEILQDPDIAIPQADIVIGGPPCQGFSLLNRQRGNDVRRELWQPFMEVVERSGAGVFVMENVQQLLRTDEHDRIVQEAERQGFHVRSAVLKAVEYGVPQARQRTFIIGSKADTGIVFPPLKTHYNPEKPIDLFEYAAKPAPWRNVEDAIADLPAPVGTEIRDVPSPLNLHFGRNPTETSLKRYKAIPEQGMNRFDLQRIAPELTPACWINKKSGGTDLFGRLWWNRPSVTIRTEFFKPEKGRYLHPEQHRPITHREAARIQTFPDDFVFCGSKIEIARQIGNAVPPQLAYHVAGVALQMLDIIRESEPVVLQTIC